MGMCSREANAGEALCQAFTGGDYRDCFQACLTAYVEAHAKPQPASREPSPLPPPDPYAFVLRDCILRVRDSGGSEPAVCHFDPPLDAMGFGQRHCDAKCAALTEAYRGTESRRPSGDE
jgi:hypothetical protein